MALGRALVKQPDVLLFDEPLSNLDARLRLSMRGEIKHLQKELGITSIYVTHDQVEAMTCRPHRRDEPGQARSVRHARRPLRRPKTLFIAGFVGNPPMNFLEVEVRREGDSFYAVNEALRVEVPPSAASQHRSTAGA